MSELSLQHIMNEMAAGDVAIAAPAPTQEFIEHCQKPLSEMDALMSQDDLLAHLQKEFFNAKGSFDRLLRENGGDDAMTEVAADMMDSAWCAMQTRMMEVRAKGDVMGRAQSMMQASMKKVKEAQEQQEQQKALALYHKMQMLQHLKNVKRAQQIKKEKDKVPFFEIVFVLMMFRLLPSGVHKPHYTPAGHAA